MAERGRSRRAGEPPDLRRLRQRIDALDRKIVALLNERARVALDVADAKAASGRPVRDADREREVLLRVTMGNGGPLPQADLIALYRRLIASTRRLEADARRQGSVGDDRGDSPMGDR